MKQFKSCYLRVLYCYCALVYRNVIHFLFIPTKIRYEIHVTHTNPLSHAVGEIKLLNLAKKY